MRRVLVANRGEIAVRVIRGCHEEGVEAVAVYSDADADALWVRMADAAVRVGEAPSARSYLVADRILEAALQTGCDAVHPGYGFLSENADFARRVTAAGLTWIGPGADAIEAMGSKTHARRRMHDAGVPIVPGTLEPLRDAEELRALAASIGLPVMLKAAAGGGGKGMRRVDDPTELEGALASAKSEAQKSFADDAVYVERLIVGARHVEIQVLADQHGHVVHLFERDCSIQRRHQKVIEETPCPVLRPETRAAMADAAVRAARAVGYVGAGTVEFLLAEDQSFYFLEMNTRLQVEHPITEMLTGIDLVRAQIKVARGEPLPWSQEEIRATGHAIECRIYAEDPTLGFRPSPGKLHGYREPGGPFVRVDAGYSEGDEVPVHYDPQIAKLVVWGRTREEALSRTRRALREYVVVGISTSIPFFLTLLEDPAFLAGRYHNGFLAGDWLERNMVSRAPDGDLPAIATAIAAFERDRRVDDAPGPEVDAWRRHARWASVLRRPL